MRIKLLNILFIAIFSITLTSCAQNKAKKEVESTNTKAVQTQPIVELINPTDLNSKLGDIQLIDIRTPKEYTNGHIKEAVNINFYDNDFIDQMSKLDKDKEIYIYCRSGGRSGRASSKLKEQGFTKIYDLQGGIINWKKKNFEVAK